MRNNENRVAVYGRVSTDGQSVDLQINELREYVARRNWHIVEEYLDVGVSGSKESRPALNRLIANTLLRRSRPCLGSRDAGDE